MHALSVVDGTSRCHHLPSAGLRLLPLVDGHADEFVMARLPRTGFEAVTKPYAPVEAGERRLTARTDRSETD